MQSLLSWLYYWLSPWLSRSWKPLEPPRTTIVVHPLHVKQNGDWDCGVACCGMVLKWLDMDEELLHTDDIARKQSPLWTIELFLFLAQHGINANMYTISIGQDWHYRDIKWYEERRKNDNFSKLDAMFSQALESGYALTEVCSCAY
jgi:hypothetical protein